MNFSIVSTFLSGGGGGKAAQLEEQQELDFESSWQKAPHPRLTSHTLVIDQDPVASGSGKNARFLHNEITTEQEGTKRCAGPWARRHPKHFAFMNALRGDDNYEAGIAILLILQRRKLRHKAVKKFDHVAKKWQRWDSNPSHLLPEAVLALTSGLNCHFLSAQSGSQWRSQIRNKETQIRGTVAPGLWNGLNGKCADNLITTVAAVRGSELSF